MENKQHSSSTFPMSSATSTNWDTPTGDLGGLANEARSKLTEAAQQAGSQAKETAVSLASEANEKFKDLMTQRVTAGADLADHISGSVRIAADDLAKNAPQLAGTRAQRG